MRKYILLILLLILPVCVWSAGVNTVANPAKVNTVVTPDKINTVAGLAGGGVTYISDVLCDDNAANTSVSNDGTGADWVANVLTNTIHDTDNPVGVGTDSFLLDERHGGTTCESIYSADNVTTEKFEFIFYYKWTDPDADGNAPHHEIPIAGISNGDAAHDDNECYIWRTGGASQIRFRMSGNGGTHIDWTSTNWTVDTNWHKVTMTVDASTAGWTSAVLKQGETTITWDSATLPDTAAVFNNPVGLSSWGQSSDYNPAAYFTVVTFEDQS